MAFVLDTGILIAEERRRGSVQNLLRQMQAAYGSVALGISAIGVIEWTHGAYRARTDPDRSRRQAFAEAAIGDLAVDPVTLEIALVGRIEGQQAAKGIGIPFEGLAIGCKAFFLGFDLLTTSIRHFQRIPGLVAVSFWRFHDCPVWEVHGEGNRMNQPSSRSQSNSRPARTQKGPPNSANGAPSYQPRPSAGVTGADGEVREGRRPASSACIRPNPLRATPRSRDAATSTPSCESEDGIARVSDRLRPSFGTFRLGSRIH